jgi:hypothetical protein
MLRRAGAIVAIISASPIGGAELIHEETFDTDGDGSRYTMNGRSVVENIDGQIGPGFWDLSSKVSFVGIPNAAPARRALFLWHHDISPETMAPEALELFDSTVSWLIDEKAGATVLYTSAEDPGNGDSVLLDRLEAGGHTVIFDIPDQPVPDPSTIDLVLKSSGSGNSSPNRFTLYPVAMLSFSGADHDDTLLSSIGRVKTFNPGEVTIDRTDHPAAGGRASPIPWVSTNQPFSTIGVSLPDESTVVASYRLERSPPVNSLAEVDQMIAGTRAAVKTTAAIAAADLIGDEFGAGGNWDANLRVPGDPIGGFAVRGTGTLEVVEDGTYTFAFRVTKGGRLRIDLDRDGLDAGDHVLVIEDLGGMHFADVSFPATGPYDFEWVAFNSSGDFGSEISVAFAEGGGLGAPVTAESWDLLGAPLEPPPVALSGSIEVTVLRPDEEPIVEQRPVLVVMDEGGPMFGGGLIASPGGSDFIGGAALARFAETTGLSPENPNSLTLHPVHVAGREDLWLTFAIAGTFVDFETADFLRVLVDIDGDGPAGFTTLVNFSGDGRGALTDGTTRVVREFQDVSYPIPAEATDLVVRFEAWNTWFNEIVAFDHVRITAGQPGSRPAVFIAPEANAIVVQFTGTLQAATTLNGSWRDVEGATSPYRIAPGSALSWQFFRAR